MSKKPKTPKTDLWMPLWIGDYLADTMKLSTAQHGAYLLLLFAYWRERGPLPDDDDDLRSIVKADLADWPVLRVKVLERFFLLEGGSWIHKRAEAELIIAGLHKARLAERSAKGNAARWGKKPNDGAGCGGDQPSGDGPSGSSNGIPEGVPEGVPQGVPVGVPTGILKESPSPSPSPNPSGSSSVPKGTGVLSPAVSSPSVPPASTPAPAPRPPVRDVAAVLLPPPGVPVPPAPPPGPTEAPVGVDGAEADGRNLTPEDKRKRAAWRAGKSLLNAQGMALAQTGTFLGKLAREYGEVVFLDALERAVVQRPADATSWIKATCQTLVGERQRTGGKQAQLENGNKAVGAAWLAKTKESTNAG